MSAARLLLVVEDTFAISGRGLIVAPRVDLGEGPIQRRLAVELRRPDGTRTRAEALGQLPFLYPHRVGESECHQLLFQHLGETDVPIGTEVWMIDET
jgi:hypothetical protein